MLKAWYLPEARKNLPWSEQNQFADYETQAQRITQERRLKSPAVAGLLSAVLPGSGQVYNGNYQSAAFSFILNSLFLATALELQRHDLNTSALAAGVIFSITYTGNIVGSMESAHTINSHYSEPFLEEQRQKSLPDLDL